MRTSSTLTRESRIELCQEPMACMACAKQVYLTNAAQVTAGPMGPTWTCGTCKIVFRMTWKNLERVQKNRSKRRAAWQRV